MSSDLFGGPQVPGYMAIRQHVINIIERSAGVERRIPSSRELAKLFKVSHPTVLRAIRDLVDDGYLVTRQGIGTFTRASSGPNGRMFMVGVIFGDGKYAYYIKSTLLFFSYMGNELLERSSACRLQQCVLACNKDEVAQTLRGFEYDALIWIYPPDEYREIIAEFKQETGLPLVVVGNRVSGISSADWNFYSERYRITRYLLERGYRSIITVNCGTDDLKQLRVEAMRKAYDEFKVPFNEKMILDQEDNVISRLEDLIDFGFVPEAIVFTGEARDFYQPLAQKIGKDSRCLFVSGGLTTHGDMNYTGLVVNRDVESVSHQLVENLMQQAVDPEAAQLIEIDIDISFEYMRDGVYCEPF